ncbi:MAG: type II toxin-antitoxin system VapC family toxin [Mycobacteriales bacterium]
MLVVDATVALRACGTELGFAELLDPDLAAPPLMWSEARSVLHELTWRREVSLADAELTRARLESSAVARRHPRRLGDEAWRIAGEFGWAKTYDAEYVALAGLLECRLVTLDARLRRGADRLGFVVAPHELHG